MAEPPLDRLRRATLAITTLQRKLEEARLTASARRGPVAIVSAGCRLPGGVCDPEAFWNLLIEGRDAITEVPRERFDIDAHFDPNPDHPNWNNDRIYEVCWRLLSEGQVDCKPIVHPIVPFADLAEEYPKIASHPEENIKLGAQF